MKVLSRILSLGCDLKYGWPLWCMAGISGGFCLKFWPQFSLYGLLLVGLVSFWALLALASLRKRIFLALLVVALNGLFIIWRYEAPPGEVSPNLWRSLEYTHISGRGQIVKIYASPWKVRALLRLSNGYLLWIESSDKHLQNCQKKILQFSGLLLPLINDTQDEGQVGIRHLVRLNSFKAISESKSYIIPDGSPVRAYIKNKIETTFSPQCREIAAAMFLGCSDFLSEEIKALFRDVGLSHMTAASGFHLSIMASMAMLVVVGSGRSAKLGAGGAILLCAVYVWIVGYIASLLRAFIMGVLALGALIVGRPVHLERTVCLAWSLMLLSCPSWIEDLGFQLSFGAIFGIICWASLANRYFHFLPNFLKQSLSLTLAVNLFLLPLLINYFQKFPSASVAANLSVVPALEAVFVLIIPALLLSAWPGIGQILPLICNYLCQYSLNMAAWLQEKMPVYACFPLSEGQIVIFYLVLIVGRLSLEALAVPNKGGK